MGKAISAFLVVAGLLGLAAAPSQAGVVAPHGSVNGTSLADYTAQWWQYVFSVPGATSPEFDATGANAHINQSGPVFFLVGSFAPASSTTVVTAERSVKINASQYLFFPIINQEFDNIGVTPPLAFPQLHDQVKASIDGTSSLNASIDGVTVPNLFSHREQSGSFSYSIPDHSIYDRFGITLPAQTTSPVASDGYWLMVTPLSVGKHDIKFGGTIGDPATFSLDITYHVEVVPLPGAFAMVLTALPVALLAWRRLRSAAC